MTKSDDSTSLVRLHGACCLECGGEIWTKPKNDGTARKRKYCGKTCASRAAEKTRPERNRESRTGSKRVSSASKSTIAKHTHACRNCGRKYVNKRLKSGEGDKYCSRECAFQHKRAKPKAKKSPVYFKECKECGALYSARHKSKSYCSSTCRSRAASKRKHQKEGSGETRCLQCGVTFTRLYGNHSKLCCDECRDKLARANKTSGKKKRREATKARLDPYEVFNRDQWKCQACGCDTPEDLRGTHHDDAPELDHIVPVSQGGDHTIENTQTLCRTCNILKSDKPMGMFIKEFIGQGAINL